MSYGGSLVEVIQHLANRFVVAEWMVLRCVMVFIALIVFGSSESIFSGGVGLLCGSAVAIFIQPPVVAYKSWQFRRGSRK
jgi:membrane protein YdbS with pleckstrin-like domain